MLPHYLLILFFVCTLACGQTVQDNESSSTGAAQSAGEKEAPIVDVAAIQQARESHTVGAQVRSRTQETALSYNETGSLSGLQDALDQESHLPALDETAADGQGPVKIILAASVEFFTTLIVLGIAFQISTKRGSLPRLASISLVVALFGAGYDLLFGSPPLDPIRFLLGLALLAVLIREFTGARQWAMVLKMAVLTRIASSMLRGLLVLGLSALDKL